MKTLVASALILVGSCSTIRHTEKIENLKDSIQFNDKAIVEQYLLTIDKEELKSHVVEVSSDKYNGRMTG
ncbi:MAG: peptidase M28, partial [Winogradskyella sp.]